MAMIDSRKHLPAWLLPTATISLMLLSSCNVGPKYAKPVATAPQVYREQSQDPAIAKEWKTAQPNDALVKGRWWELFHDDNLSNLEAQIDVSNQNIRAAEARFRQSRSLVQRYRSAYFPTVAIGGSIAGQRFSNYRPLNFPGGRTNDFLLPLDVSYEADIWGRIRNTVLAARTSAQASAADLQTIKLSTQAELALDYYELHGLDAEKQVLDDTVKAFQQAYELTQNRFKGGVAAEAEVAQAETQLKTAQAQALDVTVQRAQYEHAIAFLIGQPASTFTIPVMPIQVAPPSVPLGVPSQLLERRPDIASSERQMASANAQIGIAKAAFYPTVTIGARVGLEGNNTSNWFTWPSRFWSVGPSVSQVLFDAGRRRSITEQSTGFFDETVANYRSDVLAAFQQVEDNLAALRILAEEAKTQDEAVKASDRSLALSTNRYKGGIVTYLEVITAQNFSLTNRRVAVQLQRRRLGASVLLIKALGGGWDVSQLPKT